MKTFVIVLLWVLLLPLSSVWYGYILSILWAWFVMPAFHVAALSIALAIGLSMAVRMITSFPQPSSSKDEKEKSTGERLLDASMYSFLYPLFALAFGAIVHAFV